MQKSRLMRHILTLVTGKGAAQMITILATPVIARLFDPEDFGQMALFLSLVMILAGFGSFGYERAMLLPKDHNTAVAIARLIRMTGLGAFVLIGLTTVLLLMLDLVPSLILPLQNWILLLPIGVVFVVLMRVLEAWAIRRKNYKSMAYSDIGQATATVSSRILLGVTAGSSLWALMLGYLAGMVAKLLMQYKLGGHPTREFIGSGVEVSQRASRDVAKEFRDFPLHYVPTAFLRTLSKNLPVFLLGFFFSPVVVGLYAMANRLFRLPIDVLTRAVGNVYTQRAAEIISEGKSLKRSFVKSSLALAAVGVFPAAMLMLLGQRVCVAFLGDSWEQAGVFVAILSPWLLAMLVAIPANSIIVVQRRQKLLMKVRLAAVVLQVLAFFIADIFWATPESALACFVGVGIGVNVYIVMYSYRLVSGNA